MHQKEWENKSGKTSQHFLCPVRIKLLRKKSLHIFKTESFFLAKEIIQWKFQFSIPICNSLLFLQGKKKPLMLKIASFMKESILNASLFTDV